MSRKREEKVEEFASGGIVENGGFLVGEPTAEVMVGTEIPIMKDILIIVGGDRGACTEAFEGTDVMAIDKGISNNHMHPRYWASRFDLDDIEWRMTLANSGVIPERVFSSHSSKNSEFLDIDFYGCGSALFGVLVAVNVLGYKKIIITNVDVPEEFYGGWEKAAEFLKDKVKAIGGYPEKLFGHPEPEWLS